MEHRPQRNRMARFGHWRSALGRRVPQEIIERVAGRPVSGIVIQG
jgi:hypothetical protein